MGLFSKFFEVSDDDLRARREKIRLSWLKDGDERKRIKMDRIDNIMVKRANKRYDKEHPNAKRVNHSNGWHLESDD